MGNDEQLQKTKNLQEQEIKTQSLAESTVQKNAGMPPVINQELEKFNQQKNVNAPISEEKKSFNELAGDAIEEYEKQLVEDDEESKVTLADYDNIENLTMKGVLNAMKNDTNTKHKAYAEMERAFTSLVNYKEQYSKAIKAGRTPIEYSDVFRIAESTAKYYQVSHKKAFYMTTYGKERYKISCRIIDIVVGLKTYTQTYTTKKLKEVDDKVEKSQITKIMEEQGITDKEKGEIIADWLQNGQEYLDVLTKMLKEENLLQKDKQSLARIVADRNRRLVANKVALSMVCDENPQITLGLSDFKKSLTNYLLENINKDNESKKKIFDDLGDFKAHLNTLLDTYKNDNKDLIDKTAKKKAKFVKELGIDENDTRYWENSDVNELLINSDDAGFEARLQFFKEQSNDNMSIVDQFVDELGYSNLTADSVKQKIKKEIGIKLYTCGEVEVAEFVQDSIRRLRFLAAEEFEAESRITHLMDVLQIPKSEKDVFAKFVSVDGTVGGILKQKNSRLRKMGDTYLENLKGLKEAEKLSRNKKLMLTQEEWQKIEELKKNMGALNKTSFKAELNMILNNRNKKIDLTKPNMTFDAFDKSRAKTRVRRDIGFTERIMGDLFLKNEEITSLLNKEEIEYFRQNLLKELCRGGKDIGNLEFLPTGAIKSIATMLKKNLVSNPDFIKDLRKEFKDNKAVVNEVLLKMSLSSELLNISDLNDMVQQIREKHEYDNRVEEEKELLKKALIAGGSNDSKLSQDRYIKFLKQLDFLKKFRLGKYSLFAEKLIGKTDVYLAMMNLDQKGFEDYLENTLDKKVGEAIDAINASKLQKAFKEIYIDKRFDEIYDGNIPGGAIHIKDDMAREQKKFFEGHDIDQKKVDKNITDASDDLVKEIVRRDKKNVKKIGDIYSCVETITSQCYEDKNKLNILVSKEELKDEIRKAYERLQENRDCVNEMLREQAEKRESIFYGKEGLINSAAFVRTLRSKMMLMDNSDFLQELPELVENYEKTYKKNKAENEAKKLSAEDQKKGKELIKKKADREKIRKDRDKFIGLDGVQKTINEILLRKTLVTIGTKEKTSLSHDNWQKTRDYIKKEISKYYDLDPFLVDLLVEKNVNEVFGDKIQVHSKWLYNVSSILGEADNREDEISEDEKKLLVVNAYRHMEDFADKNKEGEYKDDRESIKGEWYKTFRKNYKELKKFEELKIDYAPLEQERINISRQLRALLSTGIGIKEQDKKAKQSFEDLVKKAYSYIDYVNKFLKCANEALESDEDYKKENAVVKDMYLNSLRQYYHDRISAEVSSDNNEGFDENKWKEELRKFAAEKNNLRFICKEAEEESVSSKDYNEKNRNFSELIGRDKIEKLIKEHGSHGCARKYKTLSENEKELFALGLMLMEKGAIGFDAGSAAVLAKSELREKEVAPRLAELTKFIAGQDYDFKIDYTQAFYKLTNVGIDYFGDEKAAFSKSAFEKAWQFAKAISGKMEKKDDKVTNDDMVRISDGISSIYEASLLGKKRQIDEVDELRKVQLTAGDVKNKLLEYCKKDAKADSLKHKILRMGNIKLFKTLSAEEEELRKKCQKRLEKLENTDMYRLMAVLQNRSVLDTSSKDSSKHVDEEKREELKLLFSEDNQDLAFQQFSNNNSCMQALISALSFQIKDERSLKDTTLNKKDFVGNSYDRHGLVDWKLLDKAFEFLDEMDHDRLVRYAIKNAPEYIEASGNEKAIEAYKKNLKGKDAKSIQKDTLEDFLKKEAEKDKLSKDNADAKLALAGYSKLTDEQKKLFIKVLGRRDFLDISKKNLYLNIVRYSKERNYANETGRFRLIDEYIDQSMGGNSGVVLSETAYADAFKSLLSTQVDDTADFKDVKNIGDVLANEKYYIAKRDTAVDWKLFNRALQFVNRATYELELREGNEELYRSAGNITRFGHLSMDYSILRKNIHNTGNQFLRFGVQQGKKLVSEDIIKDLTGDVGKDVIAAKNIVKDVSKMVAPKLYEKIDSFDEFMKVDVRKKEKRISDLPEFLTKDPKQYDLKKILVDKVTGKLYTSEDSFTNQINDLVLGALTGGVKVDKIAGLVKKKMTEKTAFGKDKTLDSVIGDYKVVGKYGDVRDEIETITNKYNEIKSMPGKITKEVKEQLHIDTVEKVLNLKVASSVKKAIQDAYADTITYVLSKVDASKGTIDPALDNKPFIKEVTAFVKDTIKTYKDANKEISELLKKPQAIVDKVQKSAKETTSAILQEAIGKEGMEFVKENTDIITGFADGLLDKASWAVGKVNKLKEYIDGFRDIALSIKNKKLLAKAGEKALDEETRSKDKETLRKAEEFENSRQKELKDNVVKEHKDLQALSSKTANTIQDLAITEDVMKMSISLAQEIFGKIDGGVATNLIKSAVNAGVEFALYCVRCVKDRKMLKTYFTETEKGQKIVKDIKTGYANLVGSEEKMQEELKDRDTLDLVCTGNGYENKDELVKDTGMKMASSIAFCASNYNPVKETKVMATTVLVVLGLKDKIGKTDAATIATIFDKMKSA